MKIPLGIKRFFGWRPPYTKEELDQIEVHQAEIRRIDTETDATVEDHFRRHMSASDRASVAASVNLFDAARLNMEVARDHLTMITAARNLQDLKTAPHKVAIRRIKDGRK